VNVKLGKIDLTVGAYIIHDNKVLLVHHNKLNLWLPVGGHIDSNETPDNALMREVKEETNLDVELFDFSQIPLTNAKNHALPFHTNLHSVGDHGHYCLFYLCITKDSQKLKINHELKGAKWFSLKDLEQEKISDDIRFIAKEAFRRYGR
jgi:8-oxo-dGTP diphosphatase